ncbi:MAG: hypothetical protein K9H49_17415 [Bacteroidales bacterium]|nr:hypothetical protein [Bacteroidales bacterium]MCF8390197.1 hypothetical protein [Bacteroidales bacterium]
MKKLYLLPLLLFLFIILSCEKDNDKDTILNYDKIRGFVQKGPYLNGTAITISELSEDLSPTGRNFSAQILDNKGTFEIKNVELNSQFVELKADGFYFNEVKNENSSAQLTLFAISDLTNKSSLNVNVLSHLEKSRVDYLISNGADFSAAKNQTINEILSIFEINKDDILESELLDITKPGDDNAILLAVSVILQGYLPVSGLSELLANISTDIREDGILNSQLLGSTLINNAKTIKLDNIRENIETRYETLGLDIVVPDFEKFVTQFIENTEFEYTGFIQYPASGKYGLNILDFTKMDYSAGTYSMNAILPEGSSLRVKISGQNWVFPAFQDNTGWEFSHWNDIDYSRIFTATRTGEIDFELRFENYQDSTWSNLIRIYVFENEATEPTFIKEFDVD